MNMFCIVQLYSTVVYMVVCRYHTVSKGSTLFCMVMCCLFDKQISKNNFFQRFAYPSPFMCKICLKRSPACQTIMLPRSSDDTILSSSDSKAQMAASCAEMKLMNLFERQAHKPLASLNICELSLQNNNNFI